MPQHDPHQKRSILPERMDTEPHLGEEAQTLSKGEMPSPEADAPAGENGHIFLFSLHEWPLLRAFRHGVMLTMPLLLAAAIGLLINNFPLAVFQDFMTETFGPSWKEPGIILYNSTIEILALVSTFTVSNCLMDFHNRKNPDTPVLPALGGITAFSCLFIMMRPDAGPEGLTLHWAGLNGLFVALTLAFVSCSVFLQLCKVRRLRLPYYSEGADPLLPHMFNALPPVLLTLAIFVILRELLDMIGIHSLQQAFYDALRAPFTGDQDSFVMFLLYTFLMQGCWFLGIHGADILDPITHQVLINGMEANSIALNADMPLPHVFTKYFFDVYVHMGGSGTTLALLAAIFLYSKDFGTRRVAKISLLPGLFNINELLIFGLPLVLNPAYIIPFLLVPPVVMTVSYLAVSTGIVPMPVHQVDWTTPFIASALISTGSWKGVALQLFNLTVAVFMYRPFVAMADNIKLSSRKATYAELIRIASSGGRSSGGKRCMDRTEGSGALARSLASEMRSWINRDEDESICLYYQPRIDYLNKSVPCVEALVRWRHPVYGMIPPDLTIAIAEDSGMTRRLDAKLMRLAFEQQARWRKDNIFLILAINISESQLRDKSLPAALSSLRERYNLPADSIMLEVREALLFDPETRYLPVLEAIHKTGINIAVDDFGKGYQTIANMQRLPISELHLDGALVRNVVSNSNNQEILASMQQMCRRLGIKTSVEFVETREQLDILLELNFSSFQGYYFSEPVPPETCEEFVRVYADTGRIPQISAQEPARMDDSKLSPQ